MKAPVLKEGPRQEVSNRPNAVLLCYPVITGGEKVHGEALNCCLGKMLQRSGLHG